MLSLRWVPCNLSTPFGIFQSRPEIPRISTARGNSAGSSCGHGALGTSSMNAKSPSCSTRSFPARPVVISLSFFCLDPSQSRRLYLEIHFLEVDIFNLNRSISQCQSQCQYTNISPTPHFPRLHSPTARQHAQLSCGATPGCT